MQRPALVLLSLFASALGCETPLDALPADTVARLDVMVFEDEPGPAPDPRPLSGWGSLILEGETSCVALPLDTVFTLNGVPANWSEPGGRGTDPFSAFMPDCAAANANWELPSDTSTAPFLFRVEHEGVALEAALDEGGAITACDFPRCVVSSDFR